MIKFQVSEDLQTSPFFFHQDIKSNEVQLTTTHFLEKSQDYAIVHLPVFPYWKDHKVIIGITLNLLVIKLKSKDLDISVLNYY